MKKILSLFLTIVMLLCAVTAQDITAYSASKPTALEKLESIQKTTGFIPGKKAAVTGNCYGFVSKVCEKLYGVPYQEGLYDNYKVHHYSGNYSTIATYKTTHSSPTAADVENIISFFKKNAKSGDIVHYGAYNSNYSKTHTIMIQSVDNTRLRIYHANYQIGQYSKESCHVDNIYWDSFRENPTQNIKNSDGSLYSLNAFLYNTMKVSGAGGVGVTINRCKKYDTLFSSPAVSDDDTPTTTQPTTETPAKVTGITVTGKTKTSISIKWTGVKNASKYYIYITNDKRGTNFNKTVTTTSTSLNNLTEGNTYTFKIRALNASGKNGPYSSSVTEKTENAKKTPKVSGVKVNSRKTTSIAVSWAKVSNATKYYIYITNDMRGTNFNKTVTSNSTSLNNLTAGNIYSFKIRAYTKDGGWGSYSTVIKTTTSPNKVKMNSFTSPKTKNLKLTWRKVADSASGYQIYIATDKNFSKNLKKVQVSGQSKVSYTGKDFVKGKTYYVKIRAYKTVDSKKYYGSFSTVKSIKCK